jgi:hypothetical protein
MAKKQIKKKENEVKRRFSGRDIALIILINAIILAPIFILIGSLSWYLDTGEFRIVMDYIGFISCIAFVIAGIMTAFLMYKLRVKSVG